MASLEGNSGWADAMNKILVVKKPKKNKTIILSKGKKLSLMKKENEENENSINAQINGTSLPKKNDIFLKGRTKPNILEREKERKLQKITVRGVVKLFNAVNKHQQATQNKSDVSGPVITKKEKVMNSVSKKTFLNYLMGEVKEEEEKDDAEEKKDTNGNDTKMEIKSEDEEDCSKSNSTWAVLQSNYGIGVKMKDWDNKNLDS